MPGKIVLDMDQFDGSGPPVEITPVPAQVPSAASPPRRTGLLEIVLRHGRRIRVDHEVDAEALRRVLQVVESLA